MRSRIILVLALIMGAFTTFLFFQYVSKFEASEVISDSVVDVVVAKQTIGEHHIITSEMLDIVRVTENNLHANTVHAMEDILGNFATTTIEEGEILLSHRTMSDKEVQHFVSRKIEEGNRAISVGVDFVRSVSNLIEPEDIVDIIYSEEVKEEDEEYLETVILFEEVRVLAVGRKLIPSTTGEEAYMEYSSVTVELKPLEAMYLAHAKESGILQFSLHSSITSENEVDDKDDNDGKD